MLLMELQNILLLLLLFKYVLNFFKSFDVQGTRILKLLMQNYAEKNILK
jgi:hypothetical protein